MFDEQPDGDPHGECADEIRRLTDFIRSRGYRRCDIAACNCLSWHGGHAEDRLREIREAFDHAGIGNGKTVLAMVAELIAALEMIAEGRDVGRHDGLPEDGPAHDVDTMFAVARRALGQTI